jgi:hypothetical protein
MIPIIVDEMDKAMTESGLILTTLVSSRIAAKSKDTGLLASSILFATKGLGGTKLEGVSQAGKKVGVGGISTSIYANYVEFGTKAHMPPVEPLILWAKRKWGLSDEAAKQAGWGVALAIADHGTYAKGNFFLAWYHDGGERKVREIWDKVPVKVLQRWEQGL